MEYKVIETHGEAIVIPEDVINKIKVFKDIEKAYKETEKQLKAELKRAMEEAGIKSFKTEGLTITYIPETTTTAFNSMAMKKDGVYEKYRMEVPKDSYVRIEAKNGER